MHALKSKALQQPYQPAQPTKLVLLSYWRVACTSKQGCDSFPMEAKQTR